MALLFQNDRKEPQNNSSTCFLIFHSYVMSARLTTNRFPDQCLNGTPNACDYHQQSHTGGHTYDDTMDARQCLICITSSDCMSGHTVGKKEAMVLLCL